MLQLHVTSTSGLSETEMFFVRDLTDLELTVRNFYFSSYSLINKIMFSISQHDFIVAKRIEEGNIKDMSKGIGSVFYNIIIS